MSTISADKRTVPMGTVLFWRQIGKLLRFFLGEYGFLCSLWFDK